MEFENPESAHFTLAAGVLPAKPSKATTLIPTKPTSAAGTGSITSPMITAKKIAKKCHPSRLSP